MPKLEEAWQKILDSEQYKSGDDAFKDRVRSRFFERTVGSSSSFKQLPAEKQQTVQQRFYSRLQPSDPTGDAVKAGATEGLKAAQKTIESPIALNEKSKEYMGAAKEKLVSGLKVSAIRSQDEAVTDIEKGKPVAAVGKAIKSTAAEAGAKTAEFVLPGSLAEAGGMEAVGGAVEAAGKTKLGNAAKTVLTEPFGKGYGESILQKIRSYGKPPVQPPPLQLAAGPEAFKPSAEAPAAPIEMSAGPGKLTVQLKNPLQSMIEEEVNYEKSLKSMAERAYKEQGIPMPQYEPFLPEVKTNLSQLRDYHGAQLEKIKAEPDKLQDLAHVEKNIQETGHARSPFLQESWEQGATIDPDVKKFGASRNLNDIKQKPLRTILHEMNDDIGSVGAIRFLGYGKTIGQNDPIALEAAKDLRAAIKLPSGKIAKEKFGASAHGYLPLDAGGENGFFDNLTKKFVSREEAASYLGWPEETIRRTGGLTAQNLRDLHNAFESSTGANPDLFDAAKNLRVAIKAADGTVHVGEFGGTHGDSFKGKLSDEVAKKGEFGFYNKATKEFMSRKDAVIYLDKADDENFLSPDSKGPVLSKKSPYNKKEVLNAAKDLRVMLVKSNREKVIGEFGESHAGLANRLNLKEKDLTEIEGLDGDYLAFFDKISQKYIGRSKAAELLGNVAYDNQPFLTGDLLEQIHNTYSANQPKTLLSDLHKAYTTYVGNREEGLHSLTLDNVKKKISENIIKKIKNERGHIVLGDADPQKWDRLHQNTRELIRRAVSLGYESGEDIIAFAARHGGAAEDLHFLKAELGATQPGPFDTGGLKDVLAAKAGNRDMRTTLWEKVKDRWTPDGKASQVRSLLQMRSGELAEGHLDSQYFIRNTTKHLSKAEDEALTFMLEGAVPKSTDWAPNASEILGLVKKPTPALKEAVSASKSYLSEAHKFLSDNFEDVGYVKDYITHLWDKPGDILLNPKSNMLGTYNPFLEERTWPSYAHGLDAGGTPKTLRASEIIGVYDRYKIKTVANIRFIEELKKMPTPQGLPAVMDASVAPIGWIKAPNIPALVGKRVHPDYLQAIKTIADEPFSNVALRAYDLLSESQRWASMTLSPFHFGSLFTISSLSSDIPFKIPLKVATMTGKYILKEAMADEADISFTSKLLKAYQGGNAAFANMPLARRATRAGLNLGNLGADQYGPLNNMLKTLEVRLDKFYLGKGIKAIRGAMDIINKPLWDYVHAGVKLMTYQEHLIDNIKNPSFSDTPVQELEQRTARFVNDLDGGQAWQTMFVSPQYQKALHRTFFFPDWMVSRLRTTLTAIKPGGLNSLESAFKQTPEGYQARKFWLRAGLVYYSSANWLNYIHTKRDFGEGSYMWSNDPGHEFDVYKGKDPKTGRKVYMNYAPAIVETFKWFQHPTRALGARFNANLQLMAEFFTGTTLSGYKLPEDQRSFTSIMKRHYAPIITKGGNDFGLFPASKGTSSYEVIKRFEGVIKNGDNPGPAIKYGVENGYNVEQLYMIAMRNVKGNMKKEILAQ